MRRFRSFAGAPVDGNMAPGADIPFATIGRQRSTAVKGQIMAPGIVRRSPSACSKAVGYRSRPRSLRIERFFNRIKHFRHLAARYETHAAKFFAILQMAAAPLVI